MSRHIRLFAAVMLALCAFLTLAGPALAEETPETALALNPASIVIDLAETSKGGTLEPVLVPADEKARYTYTSSDTGVARVNSRGVITGRKPGTATITAVLRGTDVSAVCTVVVRDTRIPESISFDRGAAITVERYESFTLTPSILPAAADQRVRWKSSNSSVASVNSKGVVTAKRGGTAVITCASRRSNDVYAAITVTVNQFPSPTAISLTPDTGYMVTGTSLQLTPVTEPAGEQVCGIFTWRSSSSRIATVTDDGLVTARGTGYVTITCASRQNTRVKATRRILVVTPDSPYYIRLNTEGDAITLNPTDVLQLTASVYPADRSQAVKWTSSRSSVVTVDQNGLITARRAGTARITATSALNRLVKFELTVNVVNLPAPDSISLSAPASTIEITDTLQLTPTTYPLGEKRSQEFKWSTSSSSIARVDENGLVTARKVGTVTVTCASRRNTRVRQTFVLKIIDSKMPDTIVFSGVSGDLSMENGQQLTLTPVIEPATATQTVVWKSSRTSVATVSPEGVVTAQRAGTAWIYATSTYSAKKYVRVKVVVTNKAAPAALAFPVPHLAVYKGGGTQLLLQPTPADASVLVSYASSDASIASVDEHGAVTTYARTGVVTITARSLKNSAVSAAMTLAVYDDSTPGSVLLSAQSLYLGKDNGQQLTASVFPATAPQDITWTSDNPAVATVDGTGYVKALGIGTTCVRAAASNGVQALCRVAVTNVQVSGVIPERTTGVADINKNLAKINAIRDSALNVISSLNVLEQISADEANARQAIIKRAFSMQAFPWMTPAIQEYWTTKYAEKRYLPGLVYYGLPYTQAGKNGNWANRNYNVDKAVSENRYADSGNGYFLLNQKNLLNGSYAGCDCSSFVNMATFGMSHPASFMKTYTMNTSSYYKTLSGYGELRPGDHLVLAKSHVVMFLYWMDAEQTKFMIIEQGGDGSTVICSIKDASFYASQNYVPRRVKAFS